MKNALKYIVTILLIPLTVLLGHTFFGNASYPAVAAIVALLSCVPFFLSFEGKKTPSRRLVLLAVMTALSVAGRFIFAPVQFFKPVTAIVVISGMYFGAEFGFMTGALSAVVSNFYFGQGPWTPFQMFAWGIIGFAAGLLSNPLARSKILLVVYAVVSGAAYSLIMDVWTATFDETAFSLAKFFAAVLSSLPVMAVYIVSNVIFILILQPLFGKKITRIIDKYGV